MLGVPTKLCSADLAVCISQPPEAGSSQHDRQDDGDGAADRAPSRESEQADDEREYARAHTHQT